jgi:SAM-dependent methyltransferase
MPTSGIILLFLILLLSIIFTFKIDTINGAAEGHREGYQQNNRFLFKRGHEIYDDFYSEIYDFLVYNDTKDEYEIGAILNRTNPTTKSVILDVGCGTGHHVGLLAKKGLNVVGIDVSPAMVEKAKMNYPQYRFIAGNVLNSGSFPNGEFTHILCLYFTVYYFQDKTMFFRNCFDWLMPGGYLIIHLVDREKFDPLLPSGNPLYIVSPQRYAKERITRSKVTFDKFKYESDFVQDSTNPNITTFNEKFIFNDGTARRQEHQFYMEPHQDILVMATQAGFIVQGQIDLVKCAYEYQYLYILTRPAN